MFQCEPWNCEYRGSQIRIPRGRLPLVASTHLTVRVLVCNVLLTLDRRTDRQTNFKHFLVAVKPFLSEKGTTCFYAVSLLSLELTSSQKISLFSSIEFLLPPYRTYNLIMEWSYEDVVRWPFGNHNIDDIIAARLRGKF